MTMWGATYRQAGVDVAGADRLIRGLRSVIRSTHGSGVLPDRGQFASLFALSAQRFRDPVLVSSTDGAGTKLTLAASAADYAGIGVDVVAMNVNDIVVYGAQPLFFLDYIAVGKLNPSLLGGLVRGLARGCRESGCALIGGETAEMPGVYRDGEYDVAGFCVGAASRRALIDGSHVRAGDAVIGLVSSGVHANGLSLVRRVFGPAELRRHRRELLVPTRIYVTPVLAVARRFPITAIAHVTGGGLARRLPSLTAQQRRLSVRWTPGSWTIPPVFRAIQAAGGVDLEEMYGTFNMGIGMALTCRRGHAAAVLRAFERRGVRAWVIGSVEQRAHA